MLKASLRLVPLIVTLALASTTSAAASAYQNGRVLGHGDSLTVLNIFSAAPGTPTPDPYVTMTTITDLRCHRPTLTCTYVTGEQTALVVPTEAAAALIGIVGAAGVVPSREHPDLIRLARMSCRFSLLTQLARCWVIEHP